MKLFLSLLLLVAVSALPLSRNPPSFPKQYTIEGVFSIPKYEIREELTVHTDEINDRQAVSYFFGRNVYTTRGDLGMVFEVVPRINETVCFSTNVSGPTGNGIPEVPLAPFLPDLSNGWEYAGEEKIRGIECEVWEQKIQNFTKTNTYRFAVSKQDGFPIQLKMHGLNVIHQSHPDLYVLDYHLFTPQIADESVFAVSPLCNTTAEFPKPVAISARVHAQIHRIASVVPARVVCDESAEFKEFRLFHGKHYASCKEHALRHNIYAKNMKLINEHNARNDVSHRLAPNKFADLSDDEFRALMLLRKGERSADNKATMTHTHDKSKLPKHVDWRKHGAVTKVKDQAFCGSCWAFGSAASLESVNYVKNKKLVSVSEQNIIDCAWGYTWSGPGGNLACDGGYASSAFQWMVDNGGIATEHSYPYSGQDGYCNAHDHGSDIKVVGYVNVSSAADLKHAIATVGTVAVAIDASHPSFRFYASGIYYEPSCKSGINDLDHEVAAVGYGEENGEEYWILKNSWSELWGDKGYVHMSAKNDCGTSTQATYPLVA